ncbi:MAG: hypothetical protein ABI346_08800, partial [Candidatus Baltobacteraceae bacterium]
GSNPRRRSQQLGGQFPLVIPRAMPGYARHNGCEQEQHAGPQAATGEGQKLLHRYASDVR